MKRTTYIFLAIALIGFVSLGINNISGTKHKIQLQEVKLQDKTSEIKLLETKYKALNTNLDKELHNNSVNQDKVKQLEAEREKLQQDKAKLETDLQARRAEKERLASISTTSKVYAASMPINGSHTELMTAAGIPYNEQASAERLVQRESSWNPNALNSIGACSLVQALPCSKIGGNWRDPVTALVWGNGYVKSRYGTWNAALAHSLANNWY